MEILIACLIILLIGGIGYMIFSSRKDRKAEVSNERLLLLERDKTRLTETKIRLETEIERKSTELREMRGEVKKILERKRQRVFL